MPEEALAHFREAVDRGAQFEEEWEERRAAYEGAHPGEWHELSMLIEGRFPDGWDSDLPRFDPGDEASMATRKASHDGDPVGREQGARSSSAARRTCPAPR